MDVWVCWVLQTLFTMPDRLPMAFKGGTSLSKVFGAIARFSEDVDITLDYRGLDGTFVEVGHNVAGIVPDEAGAGAARHGKDIARPDVAHQLRGGATEPRDCG